MTASSLMWSLTWLFKRLIQLDWRKLFRVTGFQPQLTSPLLSNLWSFPRIVQVFDSTGRAIRASWIKLAIFHNFEDFCEQFTETFAKTSLVTNVREVLISFDLHVKKKWTITFCLWRSESGYEPLNLENWSFVNSNHFDATDLRF